MLLIKTSTIYSLINRKGNSTIETSFVMGKEYFYYHYSVLSSTWWKSSQGSIYIFNIFLKITSMMMMLLFLPMLIEQFCFENLIFCIKDILRKEVSEKCWWNYIFIFLVLWKVNEKKILLFFILFSFKMWRKLSLMKRALHFFLLFISWH